jgi:hypothetical protein
MKVIEKGTDRTATAHLYLHGRVPPLDEYGEFVNSDDKAIECFIPVEEGQQIKVGGRFDGTVSGRYLKTPRRLTLTRWTDTNHWIRCLC